MCLSEMEEFRVLDKKNADLLWEEATQNLTEHSSIFFWPPKCTLSQEGFLYFGSHFFFFLFDNERTVVL